MTKSYGVLGIKKDATQDEIKSAYKKKAQEHHPDNGGDVEKMKEINEAWDNLKTPEKRAQYDSSESSFQGYSTRGFNRGFDGDIYGMDSDEFTEILRKMTEQFARSRANEDIHYVANLSLEEIYTGTELTAKINEKSIKVRIPKGSHGRRVRLTGFGEKTNPSAPPGDLYIVISPKKHPIFSVNGNDLHCAVMLTIIEIMLGAKREVKLLDGNTILVSIPEGSTNKGTIRIPGKGLPINDSYGDLYIHIEARTPILDKEQKEQLKELMNVR
jgi:DnaJ-class molecular chaperone